MNLKWPLNKDFAFTIIDDTDNSTIQNIKPIYDFLHSKGILTTKTVWVFEPKDKFTGQCLKHKEYLAFIKDLINKGFEIQIHNVGSGDFTREEIIKGYEEFKEIIGSYPSMHINHASNSDNIYWGYKRFGAILKNIIKFRYGSKRRFFGDEGDSVYFWGDICKKHIKYIRNRVFLGVNTLKYDPKMPFIEKKKKYSNYWFSSSDGHTVEEFNNLISKKNIDSLKNKKGLCIVYTHFASGYIDEHGVLNSDFVANIEYLSKQNGWFVPASEVLDFLLSNKKENLKRKPISGLYLNVLDFRWLIERVVKKVRYKR